MNKSQYAFECPEHRYCFAQVPSTNVCMILNGNKNMLTGEVTAPYEDGKCPFCKPEQRLTNGVWYHTARDLKIPKVRKNS